MLGDRVKCGNCPLFVLFYMILSCLFDNFQKKNSYSWIEGLCNMALFGTPQLMEEFIRLGLSLIDIISKHIKNNKIWRHIWQRSHYYDGMSGWAKEHSSDPGSPRAIKDFIKAMFATSKLPSSFAGIIKCKDYLNYDYKAV